MAHHDGSGGDLVVAAAPALANVGALSLLAHGGQLEPTQLALNLHILLPLRHDALQPVRLAQVLLLLRLRTSFPRRLSVIASLACSAHTLPDDVYALPRCVHRFRTVKPLQPAVSPRSCSAVCRSLSSLLSSTRGHRQHGGDLIAETDTDALCAGQPSECHNASHQPPTRSAACEQTQLTASLSYAGVF